MPALVDGANGFAGVAVVGTGTLVVTVTATDGSGNSASQAYEVDVTDAPGRRTVPIRVPSFFARGLPSRTIRIAITCHLTETRRP